jgi:hypothetical protein
MGRVGSGHGRDLGDRPLAAAQLPPCPAPVVGDGIRWADTLAVVAPLLDAEDVRGAWIVDLMVA